MDTTASTTTFHDSKRFVILFYNPIQTSADEFSHAVILPSPSRATLFLLDPLRGTSTSYTVQQPRRMSGEINLFSFVLRFTIALEGLFGEPDCYMCVLGVIAFHTAHARQRF